MRVFVAGGAGAVGRHLIPALIADGHLFAAVEDTDAFVARVRALQPAAG